MRDHCRATATAALAVLMAAPAGAQRQVFSARTLAVRVDVLVTEGPRPVPGLRAGDFELRDNGVRQRVEVIDANEVPIQAILALDTSASIQGARHPALIAAGEALLDGLKPADRAGLVTFSHAITSRISPTTDLREVRDALREMTPSGRTSIMDGVYLALTSTLDQSARSLVVLCTDGSDTTSWLQPSEVLEAARRANAVIYAVTASDGRRSSALKHLADATGGQILQAKASSDLRPAFQRILREFRNRYVLAYTPEGVDAGGFHRLEITVPGRNVTVKARTGYIGVEPSRQP
jgi:Ca-activated chloride channel family protein